MFMRGTSSICSEAPWVCSFRIILVNGPMLTTFMGAKLRAPGSHDQDVGPRNFFSLHAATRTNKLTPVPATRLLTCSPRGCAFDFALGCNHATANRRRSHYEQQTITSRIRRNHTQRRLRSEGTLAPGRCHLASQEWQRLRPSNLRGHQRKRPCRLHGTQRQFCRVTISGQGTLTGALPLFFFLSPTSSGKVAPLFGVAFSHCTSGTIRRCNAILFAARRVLRFSLRMIRVSQPVSKLCADKPRHTSVRWPRAISLRSTWQGGGNPLRCILPLCRKRHAETLPVSVPSGVLAIRVVWSMEDVQ
jgi:hypothetical protein